MKRLSLVLFILWSFWAQAQNGGIPTSYQNDGAVDLVKDGRKLLPDDLHAMIEGSKGRIDISDINPDETSDLWKNVFIQTLPIDSNPINDMDEVQYHSNIITESGSYRFNVKPGNAGGKIYTMMIGPRIHSLILAKNLLRKIGYQVPDIKYVPRVLINFKDSVEKAGFISYMDHEAMIGEKARWILEETDHQLLIQDAIVMDINHIIYNLAVGITSDMILGRRLLSSLVVPLTITNLEESVNLMRWNMGVVSNKEVQLYNNSLTDFECTWDDARWITKRIEKLKRSDWEEIVAGTSIPQVVQQILVEKIISRRNSAMRLFNVDAKEEPINPMVSNGVDLIEGKLTKQVWPGYATRFAYGDPDSPLSDSDIKSWIKSRALSTLMDSAVSQINQLHFMGTDIQGINNGKLKKIVEDSIHKANTEKSPVEIPLKAWTVPTVRGQLIFSRNLVTGTYLGTDQLLQLVDTIGVSVSGGLTIGTSGVIFGEAKAMAGKGKLLPINLVGMAGATITRTYAHLRPVTNMEKSLKYPFKNIFIPLVKSDYGKKLSAAARTQVDENATEEEKVKAYKAALQPFLDSLEIGESLLVTDTINTSAGGQASVSLYAKLLSISLGIVPGHVVMSRFHVHRATETDFHVYKDIGQKGALNMNLSVDSWIPVITLSLKNSAGTAKVKYFSLSLDPKNNPKIVENMSALRRAIVHSSTGEMEEAGHKPFVIKHAFKEKSPSMNLFVWQFIGQNSATDITVTNPKGEERYFRRQYHGITQGKNYQSYVNALITHWVGMIFNKQAGLSDSTGTNPGYSFKGSAKTKYLTLDQEKDSAGAVIEPFVRLSRISNGWSIKRKDAQATLDEMRNRYRFDFFEPAVLMQTQKIYLYNISVNLFFYKTGIEYMMGLSENEVRDIFRKNPASTTLVYNPAIPDQKYETDKNGNSVAIDDDYENGAGKFLRFMKKFRKNEKQGDEFNASKFLLKALSQAEFKMNLKGLTQLMGGDQNFYMSSRIDGFREGDEEGDKPITSNSLGEYGSPKPLGPIVQVQRQTEMIEGEFFIYWMMQRLI